MVNRIYSHIQSVSRTTPLISDWERSGSTSSPYISLNHFASSSEINYGSLCYPAAYTKLLGIETKTTR